MEVSLTFVCPRDDLSAKIQNLKEKFYWLFVGGNQDDANIQISPQPNIISYSVGATISLDLILEVVSTFKYLAI